jgi:hypothetical protein
LPSWRQIELGPPSCGISVARIAPMITRKIAPDIAGRIASFGYCLSTAKLAFAIAQPRDQRANIVLSPSIWILCVSRPNCGKPVARASG